MDLYALFELAQIKAINSAIEPTLDSIWRMKCRQYSTTYHTPLHVVKELDPITVLEALYEDRYPPSIVEEELAELVDILNKIKDPTFERMSAEETENLVDAVLNRELARAAKNKAPTPQNIKAAVEEDQAKPKSGGLDFSQLEGLESKAESNKAGFESNS